MLPIDLSGKTALITGVSSGIGAGIAEIMAKAGANICGCDIHATDESFEKKMQVHNVEVRYVRCDVTDDASLTNLVDKTVERFGKIDILISNAGKNFFESAAGCDDAEWEKNMQLNLRAHWQLAKLCRMHLQIANGVIIIITSNHAYSTIPGCFPYNVAKTALTGLVQSLAIEWGPEIRTVGIAPGFIDTPGNQQWFNSFSDPAEERMRTEKHHPTQKIGTTEEIGAWCAFLSSQYAAFANGTTYLVDGGRSALMQ
jgi:NAD(P)-dependent dehydrogenase (short-subunit alcohol dehydrogenase family)